MKVLVLFALVAVAAAFDFPEDWEAWKKEHKKQYGTVELELHRHTIWQSNKKFIDEHNQNADIFGYSVAMNEFGDLDAAEFAKMYNGYRRQASRNRNSNVRLLSAPTLPDKVDWRDKGYVTPIKNQGQCGSCWAFSATGSMEGQHFNVTGKLVSLSEQNLVDCSGKEGNLGCDGGLMDDAFEYVIDNNGIDTEGCYPYQAQDERCRYKVSCEGATINSYQDVKSGSEDQLQVAVAIIGPISVAIDASHQSFQFYKKGVYNEPACSTVELDHGVLAVGYGTTNKGEDYWLVKNSWGTDWGMEGYIEMSRNKKNQCGIATSASYPIIDKK